MSLRKGFFLLTVGFVLGVYFHDTIYPPQLIQSPLPINNPATQAALTRLLYRKDTSLYGWPYSVESDGFIVQGIWAVSCADVPQFQKVDQDRRGIWRGAENEIIEKTKGGLYVMVQGCGAERNKDGTVAKIWYPNHLLQQIKSADELKALLILHGTVFWMNYNLVDKYQTGPDHNLVAKPIPARKTL